MTLVHDPDPSSPLAFFASELRRIREEAGLTQEQLGELINYSSAQVSAVENSKRNPKKDFAEACDQALRTDGHFTRLWPMVRRAVHQASVRSYFELERDAICIENFQPINVPGLLQTEAYARALIRGACPGDGDDQIEAMVAERLERQKILRRDNAPRLFVVVDEAVLHRPVGGMDVMREQLDYLIGAADRPRITVQVIPSTVGAYPGTNGPIVCVSFQDTPDVAYFDHAGGGQVVHRPDDVRRAAYLFGALRAEALPQSASIELIRKVMKQWI
ncbi:helix-turn-helix transcriptional regulator [Sphaerisporangium flaviroseum]|uniref:Helix-turn-helix transcriptional regulator n=1 Tax=Sphaerisporangium flaviroseum TaxID=509199 RepID=A0ABP7HYQ5_9ACTN